MNDFKKGATESITKYHQHLVRFLAHKLRAALPPNISIEDLVSWGNQGLLDAITKWDPNRGNSFKTYAEYRIRGAMLDGLRDMDVIGRAVREKQKVLQTVRRKVEQRTFQTAMAYEMANEMGISETEFHRFEGKAMGDVHLNIGNEELFTPADRKALLVSTQNHSGDIISKIAARQKLEQLLEGARPVNRAMFILYYVWGLSGDEIAECFGLTASRVSQLIKSARTRRGTA